MGISRRGALRALVASSVGLGTGALAYGMAYARHRVERLDVDVKVTGLPPEFEGLRVGLITDIHHSDTVPASDVARAVTLLAAARPDLVVLGGDYVTFGDRKFVEPVAELLSPLAGAPLGSFAVLGNHDDDRDMPAALASHRFTVLKDQRTRLTIRGETLDIAGIRFWTRRPADLARVLKGAGGVTMLLAHDPRRLAEAARFDVQLVLSGHTHGGQVLVPGVGAIAGRKFPVLAGVGTEGNATVFVSRGVGTVYVPVRINCPPDVAVLTLRRASDRL
ncbi:MAG: metallophosphoesterase [Acidobacteria bacterium]|nr:metallophosphoesterase [Acidobacteriota bacterium]